jgi:hypothetical protein
LVIATASASGLIVTVTEPGRDVSDAVLVAVTETVTVDVVVWFAGNVGAVKLTVADVGDSCVTVRFTRAGAPVCVALNVSGTQPGAGRLGSVALTTKLPVALENTDTGAIGDTVGAVAWSIVTVAVVLALPQLFVAVSVSVCGVPGWQLTPAPQVAVQVAFGELGFVRMPSLLAFDHKNVMGAVPVALPFSGTVPPKATV